MEILTTKRKKTLNFYNKYKNFDFEEINDMMIDVFENIINNFSGEMTNTLTKELIFLMKNQTKQIEELHKDMGILKKDIILKLYDIKNENIDNIKLFILNNDNENVKRITDKIEQEHLKLIKEVIPKNNILFFEQYENIMRLFKEELKNLNHSDSIELKYTNLLKNLELSLLYNINNSELRIQNIILDKNTDINNNINEIKTNTINQQNTNIEIVNKLNQHLHKYNNSSLKGNISENYIESLLNNIYKSAEIKRMTDKSKSGDFIMTKNNISILFEIKNYSRNVPTEEVNKFIRDINEQNICGIMLSISSGISNKYNFQIDITNNNNVCLYIHDVNFESDKIKLGVDIIDNLYSKLKLKSSSNEISINNETLDVINKEYQLYLNKRDTAINFTKDSFKKIIQHIEDMELINLNNLLSKTYSFINTNALECDICKKFIGSNNKSLAMHKKKCKINNEIKQNINKNK